MGSFLDHVEDSNKVCLPSSLSYVGVRNNDSSVVMNLPIPVIKSRVSPCEVENDGCGQNVCD